jgi:hypothetical protein
MARQRRIDTTLEHALRVWAAQERRKWRGENAAGDPDGLDAACLLGKIREERDGASQNRVNQRTPTAAHWGEGLIIHRAMHGMPEAPRVCVWLYYLLVGPDFMPAKEKARHAGDYLGYPVSLPSFWQTLENGEHWIAARYFSIPNGAECIDTADATITA